MVSVYRVFTALREIANKEQKGFVTPAVFNSFAQMAQMNVYNELFEELSLNKRRRNRQEGAPRYLNGRKMVMEDLAYFVKVDSLSGDTNIFDKPTDLSRIISIESQSSTAGSGDAYMQDSGSFTLNKCELVYNMEQANLLLNSNLSAPTSSFPVCLIHDRLEVFPTGQTNIKIVYYRTPGSYRRNGTTSQASPNFGYSLISGVENEYLFDPETSLDFMLPPHMFPEIVFEMGKLIGIRLRDSDLQEFSQNEEAAK